MKVALLAALQKSWILAELGGREKHADKGGCVVM